MKKLFISCPNVGRTQEATNNSLERLKGIACVVFGEKDFIALTSLMPYEVNENFARDLLYTAGEACKNMIDCEYFIGVDSDLYGKEDNYKFKLINEMAKNYYPEDRIFIISNRGVSFLRDIEIFKEV